MYSLAGPPCLPSSHTLMASSVGPASELAGGTVTDAPPGSVSVNSGSVIVSPGASSEDDGGSGSDAGGAAADSLPSSSSDPQPAATSATSSTPRAAMRPHAAASPSLGGCVSPRATRSSASSRPISRPSPRGVLKIT